MRVLIVESDPNLGEIWRRHLERSGKEVVLVTNQDDAVSELMTRSFSILVLDAVLKEGSALAVADYAGFRRPDMKVVFVTPQSFFSDGSLFRLACNACAMIPSHVPPRDLDAVVDHYGRT